jgi:hypothetical protein
LKSNVILGRLLPVGDIYKATYYGEAKNTVLDAIEAG